MSAFKQILYGIIAALGLAVVVILTHQQVFNRIADELGQQAIVNNEFDFFISTRYYRIDPIREDSFTAGNYTFDIKIYNVANIKQIEGTYQIIEGFQVILHQKNTPLIDLPFSAIITTDLETLSLEYQGYNISQLPIMVFMDVEEKSTFFSKNRFYVENNFYIPKEMKIFHFGEIIGSYELNIEIEDFKLEKHLNDYLEINAFPPTNAFGDVGYSVIINIDSTYETIRNSAIYITGVFIILYGMFIYKRKYMGKQKPSEGLKRDVSRFKEEKQKKE
jgi:hypothetical protein